MARTERSIYLPGRPRAEEKDECFEDLHRRNHRAGRGLARAPCGPGIANPTVGGDSPTGTPRSDVASPIALAIEADGDTAPGILTPAEWEPKKRA
jgi:hypothetical protein